MGEIETLGISSAGVVLNTSRAVVGRLGVSRGAGGCGSGAAQLAISRTSKARARPDRNCLLLRMFCIADEFFIVRSVHCHRVGGVSQ